MRTLLVPGMALMSRLKYAYKFSLISLVFMVPIITLIYLSVTEINSNIEFAQKERLGVQYLTPLREIMRNLQQHRGLSASLLAGDAAAAEKIEAKQKQLTDAIAKIDEVDAKLGRELNTSEKWKAVKSHWDGLRTKYRGLGVKDSLREHTALIAEITDLMAYVADTSNLTLDPDLDSYYVMDTVVVRLPAITESLGQARAAGAAVATKGSATADDRAQLAVLHGSIEAGLTAVVRGLDIAANQNEGFKRRLGSKVSDSKQAVDNFTALLKQKLINAEKIDLNSKEYFAAASSVIDQVYK